MIFRHQRVAAGKNNFIELRMRGNVLQRRLPVTLIALIFGIREVSAEAIAAIYRAAALDQQQRPVAVFMQQTGYHAVLFFQRIGGKTRC
ncbi:Uncharacterised protein [Raoultella ornithinolytica]|nr:Uncharacterised protein [Raoultella ornithinolytica]